MSQSTQLPVRAVLAAVPVTDMRMSAQWYARLFGRDADEEPMATTTEWYFAPAGTLQLVTDARRAGGGLVTVQVPDVSEAVEQLAERGIGLHAEGVGDGVVFATVEDPDGNAITLVQQTD